MAVRRCDDKSYILVENMVAAGGSAEVVIPGGEYMFIVNGTLVSGVAALQFKAPNGLWSDVYVYSGSPIRTSVVPYGQTGIDLPAGSVRLNIVNNPTSVSINSYLVGLG